MQSHIPIYMLVEGQTDEIVLKKLLQHVGLAPGPVYGLKGKGDLLKRLPNYNSAAKRYPWITLIDLDHDADCAPAFVQSILPDPATLMRLRVAVRSMEAWLLADADRLARFLRVSRAKVPRNPDSLPNPKNTLINLARESRNTAIQEDIVPREGSGARVGPGYVNRVIQFVNAPETGWRIDVALQNSDSLSRCIDALQSWRIQL